MAQIDRPVMDLPHSYYPAMGEYLFRFAQLEYQLHEIVWMAFDIAYKPGRILTIGTDLKVVAAMINVIAKDSRWIKSPTRRQEMNSLANRARSYAPLRNSIVHGSWQSPDGSPNDVALHFMKQQHERILPRRDPSLDDRRIHKIASELRVLNLRAKKLIALLDQERPSSYKKSL